MVFRSQQGTGAPGAASSATTPLGFCASPALLLRASLSDSSFVARRSRATPAPRPARLRTNLAMAVQTFFATCPKGLGGVLAREVESGAVGGLVTKELASGVEFTADSLSVGYAACLWLRTAIRVLALVSRADDYYEPAGAALADYDALYAFVRRAADWGDLLRGGEATFSIQVREPPAVSARQAAAEFAGGGFRRGRDGRGGAGAPVREVFGAHRAQVCAKDAICDALRDASLPVPERPTSHAESDVPLFMALNGSEVSLYRDMAGMSLVRFVAPLSPIDMVMFSLSDSRACRFFFCCFWRAPAQAVRVVTPLSPIDMAMFSFSDPCTCHFFCTCASYLTVGTEATARCIGRRSTKQLPPEC